MYFLVDGTDIQTQETARGDGRGDGERPAAAVQTPRHPFLLIGLSKLSEVTENHRTHLV